MRPFARSEKPHAFQQRSIRHASRGKNNLLPWRKVISVVNLVRILNAHGCEPVQHFIARWYLVFINSKTIRIEYEPRLYLAVQTLHRRRRDNSLRRAADSHQRVNVCPGDRGRNTCRKVTIRNQTNASTCGSHVRNQFFVSRTIEHNHREVFNVAA